MIFKQTLQTTFEKNKTKTMKKIFLACIAIATLTTACEIEELDDTQAQTPAQSQTDEEVVVTDFTPSSKVEAESILTGQTEREWVTKDFTLAGTSSLTSCRLDDEMTFNSNGSYSYLRGESCGGEDDGSAQRVGSWELNFDTRTVIFDRGTNLEYTANIVGLTDTEVSLKGSYFNLEVKGVFSIK